jgi:hypothetical protein
LALEKGPAGGTYHGVAEEGIPFRDIAGLIARIYHAVDEEGVSMKAIAEALGRGLKVPVVSLQPEETEAHFGWLARFAPHDMPASSAITQKKLAWVPTGPGLIEDLDGMDYSKA